MIPVLSQKNVLVVCDLDFLWCMCDLEISICLPKLWPTMHLIGLDVASGGIFSSFQMGRQESALQGFPACTWHSLAYNLEWVPLPIVTWIGFHCLLSLGLGSTIAYRSWIGFYPCLLSLGLGSTSAYRYWIGFYPCLLTLGLGSRFAYWQAWIGFHLCLLTLGLGSSLPRLDWVLHLPIDTWIGFHLGLLTSLGWAGFLIAYSLNSGLGSTLPIAR